MIFEVVVGSLGKHLPPSGRPANSLRPGPNHRVLDRRRSRQSTVDSSPWPPSAARLSADGVDVIDVPAKVARRVRVLSTGHGRKPTRPTPCRAGSPRTATGLTTAVIDEAIAALRCLTEHRDDLVRTRTQTVNRLHALLTQFRPAGLPHGLTADTAAVALRSMRPRAVPARTLRQLAV